MAAMHSWDPGLTDAQSQDVLCSGESNCLKTEEWSCCEKAGAGSKPLIRSTGLPQTLSLNTNLILS